MNSKKSLAVGAVAAAALLAATGCAASTPTPSGSGEPAEDVTITYANFISNGGNEENLQKIVDAFEDENEGITVEVTTTDYADYFTQLQTDLAAGTQADVFDVDAGAFANIQASGVLAPFEGFDASAYRQGVLEAYATDGAQYALPSSFSNVVLFYNKDLFDAAGLDYPTADWTWADEQAAAEKLTDTGAGVWGSPPAHLVLRVLQGARSRTADRSSTEDGIGHRVQLRGGKESGGVAHGQDRHRHADGSDGAGHTRLRHQPLQGGQARDVHTGIWMFGLVADRPVRLGHRRRAR